MRAKSIARSSQARFWRSTLSVIRSVEMASQELEYKWIWHVIEGQQNTIQSPDNENICGGEKDDNDGSGG